MKASVRIALLMLALAALLGCAHLANRDTLPFRGLETPPRHFNGVLTLPEENKDSVPVVVLVHGTAGVDNRYAFHRPALLDAGIGTFEVDFKTNVFTATLQWNAQAANDSRRRAVAFLLQALNL